MFHVNLKTLAGILGGTAAATVITTGICALLKRNDDSPEENSVPDETADEIGASPSCMTDSEPETEAASIRAEASIREESETDDAEATAFDCRQDECRVNSGTGRKKPDRRNAPWTDKAGHSPGYYAGRIRKLRIRLNDACQQMQYGRLRYALFDARTVMDETLKLIVIHSEGEGDADANLFDNLNTCEKKHLVQENRAFFDLLHRIRKMCNNNGHRIDAEKYENSNSVCSAIMMIHELLNRAEYILVPV